MALRARHGVSVPKVPERPRDGMSPTHEKNVSALPCVICGRPEPYVTVDPHHLQRSLPANERGTSRRAADRYLIPLCREHHKAAESGGDDESWLVEQGIQGRDVAAELWSRRGDPEAMREYVVKVLRERRRIYID